MAVVNKNSVQKTINKKLLHLAEPNIPVVTIDEVATAIQVDEDGDATGFTSLTNMLFNGCTI